jgi:hypothetical protein
MIKISLIEWCDQYFKKLTIHTLLIGGLEKENFHQINE